MSISIISIVDHDRIWFKSHHGLCATEIARDPGLCASAISRKFRAIIGPNLKTHRRIDSLLPSDEFVNDRIAGFGVFADLRQKFHEIACE